MPTSTTVTSSALARIAKLLAPRRGTLYENSVIVSAPGTSAMNNSSIQPAELSGTSSPINPAARPKVSAIPAKRPKAPTSGGWRRNNRALIAR